jgi:hypothetical protein
MRIKSSKAPIINKAKLKFMTNTMKNPKGWYIYREFINRNIEPRRGDMFDRNE